MQARLTIVSALAALALGASARAADEKTKDAKPSEQASGTATSEQGGTGAGSQDPGTRAPAPGAEAAQAGADQPQQEIVGRVAKIDKGAVTVQASPLSDPHELTLTEETKVMSGGTAISVDRIKEGDMVRAVFLGDAKATSGKATEINLIKTQETQGGEQK
jgi:hypothetical protein